MLLPQNGAEFPLMVLLLMLAMPPVLIERPPPLLTYCGYPMNCHFFVVCMVLRKGSGRCAVSKIEVATVPLMPLVQLRAERKKSLVLEGRAIERSTQLLKESIGIITNQVFEVGVAEFTEDIGNVILREAAWALMFNFYQQGVGNSCTHETTRLM